MRHTPAGTRVALALLLVLGPADVSRGQGLSLNDAVELALARHEKIAAAAERLAQRQSEHAVTRGNFLPAVRLEASYTHLDDQLDIDLDPIRQVIIQLQAADQTELANLQGLLQGRAALTPEQRAAVMAQSTAALDGKLPAFRQTLKDQGYRTASLVAVQPLFMGGRLVAAERAAGAEERAAAAELRRTRTQVQWETVNQYLVVALLTQSAATRADVVAGMRRHESDAAKLLAEGLIAKAHLLRARVAVADAERNLFDDRSRLDLARVALRQTLGLAPEADIVLLDSLSYQPFADSLSVCLAEAGASQPMLETIRQKRAVAAQKVVAERADFLPRVAGVAKYELCPEDLSALEPRWMVGVQLSLPLVEGGRRHFRLQAAQHLEAEAGHVEAVAQDAVALWVEQSYRAARNAEDRWVTLGPNVDLAAENVRQNERRFQTGLGTSLELVDAELMLEKSRIERLASLHDYYRALNDLSLACGTPDRVCAVFQPKEQ